MIIDAINKKINSIDDLYLHYLINITEYNILRDSIRTPTIVELTSAHRNIVKAVKDIHKEYDEIKMLMDTDDYELSDTKIDIDVINRIEKICDEIMNTKI